MNKATYDLHCFLITNLCKGDVDFSVLSQLPVKTGNQTCCTILPYLNCATIRFNELELETQAFYLVKDRGFDTIYYPLEALLHEIAHWKQYQKAMKSKKWFKVFRFIKLGKRRNKYYENVADRYAHYCLKIIIRNIKNGTLYKKTT